ncbi:MAG: ABC transporter ATP-binding protein [Thermoflexaceae bacterium]|nr:ABC transporter ATP-binding protein [Thermoflexaceae bacterium]
MPATLEVSGLNKIYGSGEQAVHAVRNAEFSTAPGEFVAIVGPSGSGKTTLLAMIGGLLTPTSGSIRVNGRDIAQLSGRQQAAYRRRSVGYVFQANNLLPFLTARENLLVVNAIGGGARREAARRASQLLDELGLSERAAALATRLSGGERQRVAIARALMNDPALVLVDEPTASLDSQRGRLVVQSLIAEVKDRDKLGIMVTHDMEMALLADRILEMHDGALRQRPRTV